MSTIPHLRHLTDEERKSERLCNYCAVQPATRLVMIGTGTEYDACNECAAAVEQGVEDGHYHYCTCWHCTGFPSPMGFERGYANETVDCPVCSGSGQTMHGPEYDETKWEEAPAVSVVKAEP